MEGGSEGMMRSCCRIGWGGDDCDRRVGIGCGNRQRLGGRKGCRFERLKAWSEFGDDVGTFFGAV